MGLFILSIFTLTTLFSIFLSVLNYRYRLKPLPKNVQGIYEASEYERWHRYFMVKFRFGTIKKVIQFAILFILLLLGVFGWLEQLTHAGFHTPLMQTLSFVGIYFVFQTVIDIIFDYYITFVIEASFGFNRTTKKTFWIDQIKQFLLIVILVGGLLALLNTLYLAFITRLWLFALVGWIFISIVVIAIFILNNKVFVKLFNKLTPLPEGELKNKINQLSQSIGFHVSRISVMDASRRSTKLNAFFSGLGKTKEVVLYDTLMAKMNDEEILAVLAHELGHAMHKDIIHMLIKQILIFGLYALLMVVVLQTPSLFTPFGLSGVHFGFGLILFMILLAPIQLILGIPINYLSRKAEYAADAFSTIHIAPEHMVSALKKIIQENFDNLNPHPLYAFMYYTHPDHANRLKALDQPY